jgi:hypothetical protein
MKFVSFGKFAVLSMMLATGVAQATQYTTVAQTVSGTAGGTVDMTAVCPTGFSVVGGGYDLNGGVAARNLVTAVSVYGNGQYITNVVPSSSSFFVPNVVISISRPNDDNSGWRVAGFVNASSTVNVYARCASNF